MEGYNNFPLLGSGSLLLLLISIFVLFHPFPSFSLSILPYLFPSGTVRVGLYECCRVSLKSTDMGAVGLGRGAVAAPLPHPAQLLILRNRIISAKVAALFRSQERGKQSQRSRCAEAEMQRGTKDMQQKPVSQFDPDITDCSDGFGDASVLIPDWPPLHPPSFSSGRAQRASTVSGLRDWQTLFNGGWSRHL